MGRTEDVRCAGCYYLLDLLGPPRSRSMGSNFTEGKNLIDFHDAAVEVVVRRSSGSSGCGDDGCSDCRMALES